MAVDDTWVLIIRDAVAAPQRAAKKLMRAREALKECDFAAAPARPAMRRQARQRRS
jgi:hypothetical protein